jgi:hypothetical protein
LFNAWYIFYFFLNFIKKRYQQFFTYKESLNLVNKFQLINREIIYQFIAGIQIAFRLILKKKIN